METTARVISAKFTFYKAAVLAIPLVVLTFPGCLRSPEAKSAQYVETGKSLLKKHDVNRAILQFRNAIQVSPRNAEAHYQLGLASLEIQDFGTAIDEFTRTVSLNPKHGAARLRLDQLKLSTSNSEYINQAKSDLESLPANAEVLNTLALADLKLGNAAGAIQSAERALAEFPTEVYPFVAMAQAKINQKDINGAEEELKQACAKLPKSAQAYRSLGEFYLSQARLPEAEPQLQHALALDPQSGPVLNDLAHLQLAEGRKQEAEDSFRRLSKFVGYHSIYGLFLYQDGRYADAIRELEASFRENPDDRQVRSYLLIAYWKQNRQADVDKLLDQAFKRNPKDVDALLQRSEILLERGQYDEAEADLNNAAKLNSAIPEAHYLHAKLYQKRGMYAMYRQELGSALRANRGLLAVRLELAADYARTGDGKGALAVLDEALPSQKSSMQFLIAKNWALWTANDLAEMRKSIDAGLAKERNPELLIQDGLWKFRAGDSAGAQNSLREALKIDPSNLVALQALNNTYAAQKNSPASVEKVKEYAAHVPKSAPVQNFLGQLLLENGDRAEARRVLTAAKAAAPDSAELDMSLSAVDYLDHKYDAARSRLQNVVSTNPENSVAQLWLGLIEFKRGDHQAAIDHFRKVLESNPDNAMAGNDLAYELAEHTDHLDDALKYAQKAVELAPNQPAFADTLGWVLYRKGLYPSAVQYLQQASQDPQNAVARYHLAMAYAKAGDRDRSVSTLEAARRLDPGLPEAKTAQEVVGGKH